MHNIPIRFDWDDEKNDANEDKHNLRFEEAFLIWRRPNDLLIEEDTRRYNEDRFIAWGLLSNGKLLAVVHTYRNDEIRIISARYAESKERKRYFEKIYRAKR